MTCLAAGQGAIDDRLRRCIRALEMRVAHARSLIGRVSIPRYEAWEAAVRASDAQLAAMSSGLIILPRPRPDVFPATPIDPPADDEEIPF